MKKTIITLLALCCLLSCGNKKNTNAVNDTVDKDTLRIMTFNIRYDNPADADNAWKFRKEACAELIKQYRPDAVGVQEALENQLADLETLLPEYKWVGESREPGYENNEYAAIFYLKDKFEFVAGKTFWLSETPDTISRGWDARYNRIGTWARLKDRNTKKEFIHLNTHLDHKGRVARRNSSALLTETLKRMGGDSLTVFLTGDFNALPNDSLFIPIKTYMNDIRLDAAPNNFTQTTNGWGKEPDDKIIDYIFYRNSNPVSYQVIIDDFGVPFVSDHYPVYGVFTY